MSLSDFAKVMGVQYNVTIRVLDGRTYEVVQEHIGHNQATNSLLTGMAHYLTGDGILNQGIAMLSNYIPRYISLGTMGLRNQGMDGLGLPTGIGNSVVEYQNYMNRTPGYGADGYDPNDNNGRNSLGLGPMYNNNNLNCELISPSFPRSPIVYREIIPEYAAEQAHSIDVVFSAMISTGALAQFRDAGANYLFITEAGLWSRPEWSDSSNNGLLAGYRIIPSDSKNWDMTVEENREILRKNIICVRTNQVVQVIWKVQLHSIAALEKTNTSHGNCDCICDDPTHPNPNCPCHGTEYDTTLTLNEHELGATIGETVTLIATVTPLQPVTWSSSDSSIATVSDNGDVTIHNDGIVTITATATDGSEVSDSCDVYAGITIPVGELKDYDLFAANQLTLGARVQLKSRSIGVGGNVTAQASPYGAKSYPIIEVSRSEYLNIISTKQPLGLFYYTDSRYTEGFRDPVYGGWIPGYYTYYYSAVNNSTGEAITRGFTNDLAGCKKWLNSAVGILSPLGKVAGYDDNSKLTVWGDFNGEQTSDPPIITYGGYTFDIPTYINSNALVRCENNPTQDEAFPQGIHDITDTKVPEIYRLPRNLYEPGNSNVRINGDEIALMTETHVTVLAESETDSFTDEYGTTWESYKLVRTIASSSDDYGAYAEIIFETSKSDTAMLYVYPGKYSISGLIQLGNFGNVQFKDSTTLRPTIFYVAGSINLSNNTYISNRGDSKTCMVYCTGDFTSGLVDEMDLIIVAPDGTVTISNAIQDQDIILHGSIYAKNIVFGNDVQYDAKEI